MDLKSILPFLSPAAAMATGNMGGLMPLLSPAAAAMGIGSKGKRKGKVASEDDAGFGSGPNPNGSMSLNHGIDLDGALARNAEMKPQGFGDRIGEFLKSREGSSALMRAGAEMMRTRNIGAGIGAGIDQYDRTKTSIADGERDAADRALRQQQVDQTGAYQEGTLGLQRDELGEKRYQYDNPSGSDLVRERGANFRHTSPSGDRVVSERGANYRHGAPSGNAQIGLTDSREGRALDWQKWLTPSADNSMDNQTTRYTHTTPSGDARMGIGSKNLGTRTTEYQEEVPGTDGWFSGPQMRTVKEEMPIAPSQVQPNAQPEVRFDAQGQAYVQGPDGSPVRAPKFDRK